MSGQTVSLAAETIETWRTDGVAVLRQILSAEWIETLRKGVARNMETPGPYTKQYTPEGGPGGFFGDYCNWSRISEYEDFFRYSPAAEAARQLMGSKKVNLFHEHVLVKEPGTREPTPWHHDQPYYCVEGADTCSLWIPLDPVKRESAVEFVAGSHRWGRWFAPRMFATQTSYVDTDPRFEELPDIDTFAEDQRFVGFDLEPGDAIAFHFLTLHGAPGNTSTTERRRAFAARFTGDDATFARRPGIMSPPFPEVTLSDGSPLDSDWFPVLAKDESA